LVALVTLGVDAAAFAAATGSSAEATTAAARVEPARLNVLLLTGNLLDPELDLPGNESLHDLLNRSEAGGCNK
jgi:hypothetical protein